MRACITVGLVLLIASGCAKSQLSGPSPKDCNKVLKALQDTLHVENNKELSEQLRTSFDEFLQKHGEFTRNNKSGLKIGWKTITFGGSNDYNSKQVNDLLWKLHDDGNYVLTDNERFAVSANVANKHVVDAWKECLLHSKPQFDLSEAEEESTAATIVVDVSVPEGTQPTIETITTRGGTLDNPPKPHTKLKGTDRFTIHRNPGQGDVKFEELLFAIRTDVGTGLVLKNEVAKPPAPQPDTRARDEEARAQLAKRDEELKILNQTYTVWAGKEFPPNQNRHYTDLVGGRSGDYCYQNEWHVYRVICYYGDRGGGKNRPFNISFLVRKGNGAETKELKWVNPWGVPWAQQHPQPFRDETIDDKDHVINRIESHWQGGDFDGWIFGVTGGGRIDAHQAGSPVVKEGYTPRPLPDGYEWELSAIKVDGAPWMNGAEFTFRPCFSDRKRSLTSLPTTSPSR